MTIKRSEKYDAYYDDETNEWTEPKCSNPSCEFCGDRPDKPPEKWFLNMVKSCVVCVAGYIPMIVFMDYAMDIVVSRDYSDLTTLGFVCCVVFYGWFVKRYLPD